MRTLPFLLRKEFRQIFRNPALLRLMLLMPVIQLIILPQVANYTVKHVKVFIVDNDHSTSVQQLTEKIRANPHFIITGFDQNVQTGQLQIENDHADILLHIPAQFEKNLIRENEAPIHLAVNAVNGSRAAIGASYLLQVIQDFNSDIRAHMIQFPRMMPIPIIELRPLVWFNPFGDYKQFMVPGILVILVTMIGANMSALNLVREKEIGTIDQINVTPVSKGVFIIGKLIPFWIMGQISLTLGMLVGWLIYHVQPVGPIWTIYAFSSVYLGAVLGLGLLISTLSNTQQQAMLISFFFMMIFILLGGLYTPIESMPQWAQYFTMINPVRYFIEVMRNIIMKGNNFHDILPQFLKVLLMAVGFISLAILNFKKRG